jgi:hypothetical protein
MLRQECFATILQLNLACDNYLAYSQPNISNRSLLEPVWLWLYRALSYVAFNWLIPRARIEDEISSLTGYSKTEAQQWLLLVTKPSVTPHFSRYHQGLLELVVKQVESSLTRSDLKNFSQNLGFLQDNPLETEKEIPVDNLQRLADTVLDLANKMKTLEVIRAEMQRLRTMQQIGLTKSLNAQSSAYARSLYLKSDVKKLNAISELMTLAADEEEERHVAQLRAYTILQREAQNQFIDLADLSRAKLGLPV